MIALALVLAAATTSAPSLVEKPLAVETVRADVDGDGNADTVRIETRRGEVFLTLETSAGAEREIALGATVLPFLLNGKETRLAVRDVTGDRKPEILAAAHLGDRGMLFVLDEALESLYPEADAFTSETGAFPDALAVNTDGTVEIAALDFTADGPREALFTFRYGKLGYALAKTTPAD